MQKKNPERQRQHTPESMQRVNFLYGILKISEFKSAPCDIRQLSKHYPANCLSYKTVCKGVEIITITFYTSF